MTVPRFFRGPQIGTTRDGRFYVWQKERYWSVTTIINGGAPKPALLPWGIKMVAEGAVSLAEELPALVRKDRDAAVRMLKDLPYASRDRAANLGSTIHAAAEAYVLERPYPEWDDATAPYMRAFVEWLEDFRPTFVAVEVPVFSRTQRYAGTLDAIVERDGRRLLIDYKSGKGVYPEVGLQLAAYRYAETFLGMPDGSEAPMPEVDGCAVVHLRPKAGYEFIPIRADEEIFRAFLYVREVFRFLHETASSIVGKPMAPSDDALARRLARSIKQVTPA
ncbi:MAG: PD-(D/E)XK nuclease family protein [Actinomycetota bacterium]